jgi:hypothetical protein
MNYYSFFSVTITARRESRPSLRAFPTLPHPAGKSLPFQRRFFNPAETKNAFLLERAYSFS